MVDYNINSLAEIRAAGLRAVFDALGPIGYAKFVQMYEPGHGDYTNEKYERPKPDPEELNRELRRYAQMRREATP